MSIDRTELDLLRGALEDLATAHPADLRDALRDFGWADLLVEDPAVAVEVLFRLQGERLTDETLLDEVVLAAIEGSAAAAVVLPLPGQELSSRYDSEGVRVDGVFTRPVEAGATVLVSCRALGGTAVLAVPVDGLLQKAAQGLDLGRPWVRVRGDVHPGAVAHVGGDAAWERMLAAGRRALAAELLGLGTRMLDLAVEHTSSRVQFGQALATFQVVRHKLADVRVWGEVAELAFAAAWEDTDPLAATLAKSAAVRYTATAREHVQQLLGGMGFSWEHDFHRYLRRAIVLESLLGGASALRAEIGTSICESGRLPDLAAL
ncbi:hypothetical protein GCM10009547_09040 [Sporichthya brevicatena]|uniref:Acyl-CoA dehydrogenase/oxidase C-terminal domain-containing protein n=1 Tax=Sporichthya brevicatena TaxID=171442 RepID=A0ABN1GDC4_9ACTN